MAQTPRDSASPLHNIVAATDLSDTAATALQWAREIAADHQACLHIVHASKLAGWSTDYREVDARIPSEIQNATRKKLEETAEGFRQEGLRVDTTIKPGEPCEVVLSAADLCQADLVVVGTRGQRGLDYLLLGSTAQRVVQRAVSPVLTVHPHDAEKARPIRRILVATDFSAEAEAALHTCLTLSSAAPVETQVLLVHAYLVPYDLMGADGVVSASAGLEQWKTAQSEVEQRLESSVRQIETSGVQVEVLGLEGYPPEVIIDKAEENNVDLIAMGTHGRTGLSHVLLGSTAERVIHRAHCPVLTVRRARPEG